MIKQFRISYKIITAIVACSIIISSIIGYISITRGSKVIKRNAERKLQLKAEKQANHFTAIMSRAEDNIYGLNATIKATLDIDKFSDQYLNKDELVSLADSLSNTAVDLEELVAQFDLGKKEY